MGASNYLGLRSEIEQAGGSLAAEAPLAPRPGDGGGVHRRRFGPAPRLCRRAAAWASRSSRRRRLLRDRAPGAGLVRAAFVGKTTWRSAIEMLAVGGLAGGAAYLVGRVGRVVRALTPRHVLVLDELVSCQAGERVANGLADGLLDVIRHRSRGQMRHRLRARASASHTSLGTRSRCRCVARDRRTAWVVRSPSSFFENAVRTSGQSGRRAIDSSPNLSSRSARTLARARWRRLLTASTLVSVIRATSGAVRPSTSRRTRTSRDSGSSDSMTPARARLTSCWEAISSGAGPAAGRLAPRSSSEQLLGRGVLGAAAALDAEAAGDRVEPGRQRRSAPEVSDVARRREERLLEDLLRVFCVSAHPQAEAEDALLVLLEQRFDRFGRSGPRSRDQLVIWRRNV